MPKGYCNCAISKPPTKGPITVCIPSFTLFRQKFLRRMRTLGDGGGSFELWIQKNRDFPRGCLLKFDGGRMSNDESLTWGDGGSNPPEENYFFLECSASKTTSTECYGWEFSEIFLNSEKIDSGPAKIPFKIKKNSEKFFLCRPEFYLRVHHECNSPNGEWKSVFPVFRVYTPRTYDKHVHEPIVLDTPQPMAPTNSGENREKKFGKFLRPRKPA